MQYLNCCLNDWLEIGIKHIDSNLMDKVKNDLSSLNKLLLNKNYKGEGALQYIENTKWLRDKLQLVNIFISLVENARCCRKKYNTNSISAIKENCEFWINTCNSYSTISYDDKYLCDSNEELSAEIPVKGEGNTDRFKWIIIKIYDACSYDAKYLLYNLNCRKFLMLKDNKGHFEKLMNINREELLVNLERKDGKYTLIDANNQKIKKL